MTETSELPVKLSEEKPSQPKPIEVKKPFVGIPGKPTFGNSRNPMLNRPGFGGGKPGGGRPVIRKHSARSR